MPRPFMLLPFLLCAGCARRPESFAPPPQRQPLIVPASNALSYSVSMSDANAGIYLVQDFAASGPGTWRWAYSHPVMRFFVPASPRLRFNLDFALPERTFRETGPVTLTIRINGELLDRHRCDAPGDQRYSHDVPPGLVRANTVNLVAIDPDPVWVSKADGGKLGFILSRAGFTE